MNTNTLYPHIREENGRRLPGTFARLNWECPPMALGTCHCTLCRDGKGSAVCTFACNQIAALFATEPLTLHP